MNNKKRQELILEQMNNYKLYLEKLHKENPELAKIESKNALIRIEIIDEEGNLVPPYNGEKVHDDDFERGPRKILKK